ncbi:MAG: 4Fe-4S binding protein [Chloroflexota bacterium]
MTKKSDNELTAGDFKVGAIVTEPASARQYQTGTWRSERAIMNREKCTKCGLCYIFCPEGCIQPAPDAEGYFDIDLFYCKGCGICAHECPSDAITMVEEAE